MMASSPGVTQAASDYRVDAVPLVSIHFDSAASGTPALTRCSNSCGLIGERQSDQQGLDVNLSNYTSAGPVVITF